MLHLWYYSDFLFTKQIAYWTALQMFPSNHFTHHSGPGEKHHRRMKERTEGQELEEFVKSGLAIFPFSLKATEKTHPSIHQQGSPYASRRGDSERKLLRFYYLPDKQTWMGKATYIMDAFWESLPVPVVWVYQAAASYCHSFRKLKKVKPKELWMINFS